MPDSIFVWTFGDVVSAIVISLIATVVIIGAIVIGVDSLVHWLKRKWRAKR